MQLRAHGAGSRRGACELACRLTGVAWRRPARGVAPGRPWPTGRTRRRRRARLAPRAQPPAWPAATAVDRRARTDHAGPGGAATGVGSLPGTDIAEAVRIVLGELPDLPHLPELPARGPGADMIGRGAGAAGRAAGRALRRPVAARRAARPRPAARASTCWQRDLDALAEQAEGYAGPLRCRSAGPWTLAAEHRAAARRRGRCRDPGAVRDLRRVAGRGAARARRRGPPARCPAPTVLLQLDEPSLPAVLAGAVPTASGLGTLPRGRPRRPRARRCGAVVEAVGVPSVVHCCAAATCRSPCCATAGAGGGIALDLSTLVTSLDPLGEAVEPGSACFAGASCPPTPVRLRRPGCCRPARPDAVRRAVAARSASRRRRLAAQVRRHAGLRRCAGATPRRDAARAAAAGPASDAPARRCRRMQWPSRRRRRPRG